MHKLEINQLGSITHCQITIKDFTVLTGPQASGKSTIAKAVFYFRTVKDDILNLVIKELSHLNGEKGLQWNLERQLKAKFLETFGSSWGMSDEMCLQYLYDQQTSVKVRLVPDETHMHPNFVMIDMSDNIKDCLAQIQNEIKYPSGRDIKEYTEVRLIEVFSDPFETVFIPAGRSMITLLTNQLNYIFTSMDENQKRNIDYSTRNYIERILRLKPIFSEGMEELFYESSNIGKEDDRQDILRRALQLNDLIVKGKYRYVNGEERLSLSEWKYVKINFASSGQQESVWILNLVYYYLLQNKKIYLILEEPESHLYPDAQKYMAEFIGLAQNAGNQVFVTTHSPYILGEFNNLLYGFQIREKYKVNMGSILHESELLSPQKCSAFYVSSGKLKSCIDHETKLIQNEVIDGASDLINQEDEDIFHLGQRGGGGKE